MNISERRRWRRSRIFIDTSEHISLFGLIAGFERANVCWDHIEKANTFDDKIGHFMRYFVVF